MNKQRLLGNDPHEVITRDILASMATRHYDMNATDDLGNSDLMAACYLNDWALIDKLLEMKANIHQTNVANQNAFNLLASRAIKDSTQRRFALKVMTQLSHLGCDVDLRNPQGCTALSLSCCVAAKDVTQALISLKAQVDIPDNHNETALAKACSHSQIDAIFLVCETASSECDTQKFKNQISHLPSSIATDYAHKMLDSITLNFRLHDSMHSLKPAPARKNRRF